MSDIFREIDEELRRDNLLKLWARYGRYIVIVVVAAIIVAAGIVAWRNHQLAQRRDQSARFASALALLRDGNDAGAATLFAAVERESGGYATLAGFERAEVLAKTGDAKGAVAAYDQLSERTDLVPSFRDLATLLSVMHQLDAGDPKRLIERLQPLTAKDSPWRPTALEMTAVIRLKSDDRAGSLDIYKSLADDLSAPPGLRARAAEMTAALLPAAPTASRATAPIASPTPALAPPAESASPPPLAAPPVAAPPTSLPPLPSPTPPAALSAPNSTPTPASTPAPATPPASAALPEQK